MERRLQATLVMEAADEIRRQDEDALVVADDLGDLRGPGQPASRKRCSAASRSSAPITATSSPTAPQGTSTQSAACDTRVSSRRPTQAATRGGRVLRERVTGIEPALPAWKNPPSHPRSSVSRGRSARYRCPRGSTEIRHFPATWGTRRTGTGEFGGRILGVLPDGRSTGEAWHVGRVNPRDRTLNTLGIGLGAASHAAAGQCLATIASSSVCNA